MLRPEDLLLARFRLEARLGAGGFGEVWRGLDEQLVRPVAIKVLHDAVTDEAARARFREEGRITSGLSHPHVVALYDFGFFEGGRPILVYELVEGGSLLAPGQVRPAQLRDWGAQLADALAASHAAGVLHRDLKPENVLLRDGRDAVLCDFGIARDVTRQTRLTEAGVLQGTPAYMAPELWKGSPASPASDQFSWAATLLAVAGGGTVYGDADVGAILRVVQAERAFEVPSCPALREAGRQVLVRALSKDPNQRYPTMDAAGAAWRQALEISDSGPTPVLGPPREAAPPGVGQTVQTERETPLPAAGSGELRVRTTKPNLRRRRRGAFLAIAVLAGLAGAAVFRGPSPSRVEQIRMAADGAGVLRLVEAGQDNLLVGLSEYARASAAAEGELVAPEAGVAGGLPREDFGPALLAQVDALAAALGPALDKLDSGQRRSLLERNVEIPRRAIQDLASSGKLPELTSSLRSALAARLLQVADEVDAPSKTRRVALFASLLGPLEGRAEGGAFSAAVATLGRDPDPLLRAWMRLRLLEAVEVGAEGDCAVSLGFIEALVPPGPPQRGGEGLRAQLAVEFERRLLEQVFPRLAACPLEARPVTWGLVDRALASEDRDLVRSPRDAIAAAARIERAQAAAPVAGADDSALISWSRRRLAARRAEAEALARSELPGWVRELSDPVEPVARSEGTLGLEALGSLARWREVCHRALQATDEELPPVAWPWLVRNLLWAPPVPTRSLAGPAASPRAQEVVDGLVEELRDDGEIRILDYTPRRRRVAVLGLLILQRAGLEVGVDAFELALKGLPFEEVPALRGWMVGALLETLQGLPSKVRSYCGSRSQLLHELSDLEPLEPFPLAQLEAARRVLIEGYALGSNCPSRLPEGYWERIERARVLVESQLRRDPGLVEEAVDRSVAREHFTMGALNPNEVRAVRREMIRMRDDARAHRLSVTPQTAPVAGEGASG